MDGADGVQMRALEALFGMNDVGVAEVHGVWIGRNCAIRLEMWVE